MLWNFYSCYCSFPPADRGRTANTTAAALVFSLSLSLRLVILAPFSFCFLSLSAWHFIGSQIRLRTLVTTGCLRVCDWMCVCCSGEWVVAWLFLSRLDRPAPEDQWGVWVRVGGGVRLFICPFTYLSLSSVSPFISFFPLQRDWKEQGPGMDCCDWIKYISSRAKGWILMWDPGRERRKCV